VEILVGVGQVTGWDVTGQGLEKEFAEGQVATEGVGHQAGGVLVVDHGDDHQVAPGGCAEVSDQPRVGSCLPKCRLQTLNLGQRDRR
jgi:hypothetical protein